MATIVRFRTDWQSQDGYAQILEFLKSKHISGINCHETDSNDRNPHHHWCLFVPYKTVESCRQAFLRACPSVKGNGSYSMSPCDEAKLVEYYRYMMKGKSREEAPIVQWRCGLVYTSEWVQARHDEYWDEHQRLRASSKPSKSSGPSMSMLDHVVSEAEQQGITWNRRQDLAIIYCNEIKHRRKPLNLFAAKAVINSAQLLLGGKDALEEFSLQI